MEKRVCMYCHKNINKEEKYYWHALGTDSEGKIVGNYYAHDKCYLKGHIGKFIKVNERFKNISELNVEYRHNEFAICICETEILETNALPENRRTIDNPDCPACHPKKK